MKNKLQDNQIKNKELITYIYLYLLTFKMLNFFICVLDMHLIYIIMPNSFDLE